MREPDFICQQKGACTDAESAWEQIEKVRRDLPELLAKHITVTDIVLLSGGRVIKDRVGFYDAWKTATLLHRTPKIELRISTDPGNSEICQDICCYMGAFPSEDATTWVCDDIRLALISKYSKDTAVEAAIRNLSGQLQESEVFESVLISKW